MGDIEGWSALGGRMVEPLQKPLRVVCGGEYGGEYGDLTATPSSLIGGICNRSTSSSRPSVCTDHRLRYGLHTCAVARGKQCVLCMRMCASM